MISRLFAGSPGDDGRAEIAAAQDSLAAIEPEPAADLGPRAVALQAVLGEDRLDFGFELPKLFGGEGLVTSLGFVTACLRRKKSATIATEADVIRNVPSAARPAIQCLRRLDCPVLATMNSSSTRIERAVKLCGQWGREVIAGRNGDCRSYRMPWSRVAPPALSTHVYGLRRPVSLSRAAQG